MTNHNQDHQTSKLEETVNARPATSNEVSYRDGYVRGQVTENRLQQEENLEQLRQEENLRVRDNDNAARGLLIGILLTSLAGLVAGIVFFAYSNKETESTDPIAPSPTLSPAPSSDITKPQEPQKQTTIIERTVEKVVPVPQQPATPSKPAPTKVEIKMPESSRQEPAKTQPPATQNPTPTSQAQPSTQTGTSQTQPTQTGESQSQSDQIRDLQNQLQPTNIPAERNSSSNNQSTAPNSP